MDELMMAKAIEALRGAFGTAATAAAPSGWCGPRGAGLASGWFSVVELAQALAERGDDWPEDWAGERGAEEGNAGAGGGSAAGQLPLSLVGGGIGAARAAAGASLAGDVWARGADLCLGPHGLRLLVSPSSQSLPRLWFDAATLAALRMPYLTLDNIKGGLWYECHRCGTRFERPNPLKLHLWLRCAAPTPAAFWPRALPLLQAALTAPHHHNEAFEAVMTEVDLEAREAGGTRRHTCPFCGKLYSRRYGLKIHIRTHTGYKPLRCRHCARAFGDPSNLNKHLRLHDAHNQHTEGATVLRCNRCGQRAARRRDLDRHRRTKHPPSPPPPTSTAAKATLQAAPT